MSKFKELVNMALSLVWEYHIDTVIIFFGSIVSILTIFYGTVWVLLIISIGSIYTMIRINDQDIIGPVLGIGILLILMGAALVENMSTRYFVSQEYIQYQDVKLVENGFKLIANYSDDKNIIVANLNELTWYKLDRPGCKPIRVDTILRYYIDGIETKQDFMCKNRLRLYNEQFNYD